MRWLVLAMTLAACGGYDDVPLPLRETAELRVERVDRFVEGPGVVQIALDPPSDASGPFVIVGNPTIQSSGARVIAWAVGPCRGSPAPGDTALRVCMSTQFGSDEPLIVTLVLESRGDGRRFTMVGGEPSNEDDE